MKKLQISGDGDDLQLGATKGTFVHSNRHRHPTTDRAAGGAAPPSASCIIFPDIQLPELTMRRVMRTPGPVLRAQDVHNFVN